ncbi:hypothetical protein AVEN_240833-1 [Araneus ventricosus]|uniref:Ubiquitin-like protease family profile domain-containing protein n=1 Tax=Araneus ventricosus TaxID=182803 RepID=A0A4Y2FNZ7_ARAVE|nr:hypothetical protein AVEN_240833-1 [Araneus ventricosus]
MCIEQKNLVSVTYYSIHNHSIGYENTKYHPLKESTRDLIKSYLLLSFPVSKIVSLLRGDVGSRDKRNFHPTKEAFISRKTIRAYLRHLRNTMQPASDAVSVSCIVENLKNEPYNPILIFKLQDSKTIWGPSDLDSLPNWESSFVLGFQTKEQGDMLMKHSHKVLCIDATHGTNFYDFHLLSLHIQDEYGQGYAVAHFITNNLDFHTLVVLFSSLRCKIPNLKVNTVMTDDDGCSFNAFNSVFGPNIKHLLCQWHVYNAWKRQLVSKVHDKSHRDKMLEELLKIMYEKSFENRLLMFLNDYSNKCQKFTDYFVKNYSGRKELWATCLRKFPHGDTNTNNYCESFHNQLKTVYFERKYNRRIDELILTLLRIEKDRFLTYYSNVVNNVPAHSKLTKTVKEKHDRGVKIQDMDVVEYDGHWEVKSQSVKGKVYVVRKVADSCGLMDHCYFKCANINCAALCSHLYDCSCEDDSNLCKHIHKVHILYSEIKTHVTDDFIEIDNEENSSAISSEILNVDILSITESCRSKVTECKKLCSEILELIEIPRVKEVMLNNAVSCLSTLVASMRGVLNLKNNLVSIAPQLYVAPNQKIIPQVKFYRTSQRKKRKGSFAKNSNKKQRLSEIFFDEPDDPVQRESGVKSFSVENSECAGFSVFQKFNKINVKNPTATMLTINDIDLSFYMLKSLDPYITVEEEECLKSVSSIFRKGWLYDSIIDAWNFLQTRKFKNLKAIESFISNLIFNQTSILEFSWIQEIANFDFLIIPVNLKSLHWTLIIANMKNKIFEYFDPLGYKPDRDTSTLIRQWCMILNYLLNSDSHWQIVFPPHAKQIDTFNCGVYISSYVYRKFNGLSLTEDLNVDAFRAIMFEEITAGLNF